MTGPRAGGAALALAAWLVTASAGAQVPEPSSSELVSSARASSSTPALAVPAALGESGVQHVETRSGGRGFLTDVFGDYRAMFSLENAEWYSVGGVGALAIHGADEYLRAKTQNEEATFARSVEAGSTYGNLSAQVPLALGWWIAGHVSGSSRAAAAGRDLLRGQISALSWTYALKYAANRERPNGDPRSFPSGHASATFATAMVLQQHYGWKLGVPFFALSSYTALSRITVNKHWASDVAFGSVVGMVCGRTVTVHVRQAKVRVVPHAMNGGGAVLFTVVR